ncbi:MAG: PSD1 and planctomycete cytochrome C domain-containing protein [Verrucomicrobiota bacterium]|nr:PSD1 and planctomycete cytochrome C domain-containing protein [Verrucomicrobiota bacterium]
MISPILLAFVALAGAAETTAIAPAAQTPKFSSGQVEFFEKRIRPVLAEQCAKCHSAQAEKIKGGFVIDSRAQLLKGGDSGPALVEGQPDKSLLIEAIRYANEDLQMPPKHRLTEQQVRDFEEWVKMGVPDPRDGAAPAPPAYDYEAAKRFWSFQPVKDPAPPEVKTPGWVRTPVDRFILVKLEEKGLPPNPDAEKRALLRRATFDLTGLPPAPLEMEAFLNDTAPDAFAKVVDRLLASPAYGEKWGRHWLDVVRYADTSGCNSDFPVPSAFRYRNYVIDSFNRDKPYDQLLREQIAGDLLPAASEQERFEKIIATGYLAIARRFGSRNKEFHLTIEDTIDSLGKAMLGLSLGCARCHDHKFDPVPAKDYYALYGIFDSTRFAFPGTEILRHTTDFIPLAPAEEAAKFMAEAKELAALDERVEDLKSEKKQLAREETKQEELASRAPQEPAKELETPPIATASKRTSADAERELNEAVAQQQQLETGVERLPKAYAVSEGQPHDAPLHRKGDPKNLAEPVPRGFLSILGGQTLPPDEKEKTSGRRQLAEWLTDPANPLTARVMVNRIWQHHFGKGIVPTPNDFGTRGQAPTHPELLDWLAKRFVESGWSIKAMHRLMMLSHTYQLSAADRPDGVTADAGNELLWRFHRRRLSAEELRDAMLFVSGALDRSAGERHPFPHEGEWRYTQHKPFVANYESRRRSVYLMQQRIRKQPFLEVFDGADTNVTTAARPISTTPIQALFMMNDAFAHGQAATFAERLERMSTEESARIQRAYELALNRPAAEDEVAAALEYLREVRGALRETELPAEQQPRAALASFTRVLMSSNEFVFVE